MLFLSVNSGFSSNSITYKSLSVSTSLIQRLFLYTAIPIVMGHINLSIQQDAAIRTYILSNAEYMGKAWFAEVNDDQSVKIITQFECKKFEDCFIELQQFLKQIGKVKKVSGTESRHRIEMLENLLIGRLELDRNASDKTSSATHDHYWNWLKHDHYMIL